MIMSIASFRIAAGIAATVMIISISIVGCSSEEPRVERCTESGRSFMGLFDASSERVLDVGFYAFFKPVSYSKDADPNSEDFNTHMGYEADLLTALESINGSGLTFKRHPIQPWDDIWLRSVDEYDVVGGGITILDTRTRDASGNQVVQFTSGHIAFRQTLLVRNEDAERLNSYDALTSDVKVGALAGTTGEARLLQLVGLADADGVLAAGTHVVTPQGEVTADGSADYFINAAGEAASLADRTHLYPPSDSMPQVVYLGDIEGEQDLIDALADGRIDGLARGEIGNIDASTEHGNAFTVPIVDDKTEWGGFTLSVENADLASCIDGHINYLTDNRRIGYPEWKANPNVFLDRATALVR